MGTQEYSEPPQGREHIIAHVAMFLCSLSALIILTALGVDISWLFLIVIGEITLSLTDQN